MLRKLVVAALALLVGTAGSGVDASLATGTPPSLYDYSYNGVTTYCYWVKQGLNMSSFDYSYVKIEGKGSQCPVLISITQTTTGTILAGADVEYQFTVTLNFNDNVFGMTALEATVPDPTTKRPVQIAHANVHACSRTTVCDVFRDGSNRRISAQETSNFTDEKALFTQRVNYAKSGDYNVFAHVILPPKNAATETYQFVTFLTTSISSSGSSSSSTTTAASDDSSGAGTTIGIIVGSVAALLLVVVAFIFIRRKKPAMTPGNDHFRHSGFTTTKNSRADWNNEPEIQFGHERYLQSNLSEYSKQPPGLSASALMFQDKDYNRSSRLLKQKTVSSSGSSNHSAGSPRLRGAAGGYSSSRKSAIQLPDHGIATYETYYNQEPSYELHSSDMISFNSDTSDAYTNVAHAYAANGAKAYVPGSSSSGRRGGYDQHPPPIYESSGNAYPYDRESDLSSLNDDDDFDDRGRGIDRGLRPVSEMNRDSDASMGTVDFALPPPLRESAFRPTGDSFRAEDVPNLADTKLTFNDEEVSKATIEYIDSLRNQNYRDTQASDYVSDFGDTLRDSAQSDQVFGNSYRSTHGQFTDTAFRPPKKRAPSADSESYEF